MKKNNYKYLLSCASGIALLLSQNSTTMAANPTGAMKVTTTPTSSCLFGTINTLDFGTVSGANDAVEVAADFEVSCSNGINYHLVANGGLHSLDESFRRMINDDGSAGINYQLYDAAGATSVWTPNTRFFANSLHTGNGNTQTYTVYGKINDKSLDELPIDKLDAVFSDTVTITIKIATQ